MGTDSRHHGNRHFGTVDIMGIEILGIDIMGVDFLGIDILALPPRYIYRTCVTDVYIVNAVRANIVSVETSSFLLHSYLT